MYAKNPSPPHTHPLNSTKYWLPQRGCFIFIIVLLLFSGCKKYEPVAQVPQPAYGAIAAFAKAHLPWPVYQAYDWSSIKEVAHGDSIVAWMVSATTQPSNTILSLQITAANGKPAAIIQHRIDSVYAIAAGNGKIFL